MNARLFIYSITIATTVYSSNQKGIGLDFNSCMAHSRSYDRTFACHDEFWKQVKELYERNIIRKPTFSPKPSIPKIIHQIWVGSPLPTKYKSLQATWKKKHPDWKYILWTDKELNKLPMINKDKYHKAINYGEKSDIARYEILYQFGGVYVDTDFECLQPLDPLHHLCDFYSGISYDKECTLYSAIIAAKPGHAILKKCVHNLALITSQDNNVHQIIERTGPYFLTRCVRESLHAAHDRIVLFPVNYFYPWPGEFRFQNSRAEIEQWFRPESFAVHHWHCSWQ